MRLADVPCPPQLPHRAVVPDRLHHAPQSNPDIVAIASLSPLAPAIPPERSVHLPHGNAPSIVRFQKAAASPTASSHPLATYRSETPQLCVRRRRSKPPPASARRRVANRHRPRPQCGSSVAAPLLAASLHAASAASCSSSRIIPI